METMKKEWGKPLTSVQEFVPSEFCAPCGDGTTEVTYYFVCDGAVTGYSNYKVYLDSNNNGQWDQYSDTNLTQGWSTYHPCNEPHTVTVPKGTSIDNIFPKGFMIPYNYGSLDTNHVTPVRIWRGDYNDNVHCTLTLKESEFTPHNPS